MTILQLAFLIHVVSSFILVLAQLRKGFESLVIVLKIIHFHFKSSNK